MVRIITCNVNGIRSAHRKGFFDWLKKQNADLVCLQETKAQIAQLTDPVFHPEGYHVYYAEAQKKGYSGVALYSREKPLKVETHLGWPVADEEGRYLLAKFKSFNCASIYFPSGTSGDARQALKIDFLEKFKTHLMKTSTKGAPFIYCGDFNIAHTQLDIKNWRGNQKNSGFLPEEREWMTELFTQLNYRDAFRVLNQAPDQYTWWSNRGQAYAKNVGWRIDYQVIDKRLINAVKNVAIYKEEKFSDHAPLLIDYAL